MGDTLLMAVGLALVLEGLLPLFNPKGWRQAMTRAMGLNDGQLRFLGLAAALGGGLLILLAGR